MTDDDVSELGRAFDEPGNARSVTLADNLPAQAIMTDFLALHARDAPRTRFARLFGVTPLSPQSKRLYQGVLGELEVGETLAALDSEWVVLHALPVAGGIDIDHLAIGPSGVYIITTRNHPGEPVWASQRTLIVGDIRYPDIRNMEYEMGRVERLLTAAAGRAVEVSGVLAVVSPKTLTVRHKHRDVEVISADRLALWLSGRRRVLAPDEVADIAHATALSTTWHDDDSEPIDAVSQRACFEQIRREIARAWKLQVGWATVMTLIGAGSFVTITYVILLSALGLIPR
ncbi:MAG: nuclease-related domain-containing protein [Microbacteriaceae bacterium]